MNKKIRDNYDKYCSFINEEKILAKDQMILDEDKASRPDFKEKSMLAYSNNIPEEITFTVQQKKKDEADFKFNLRCKPFCDQPLFRYDSTGPSHRNSSTSTSIDKQMVTTPHFHKFTSDRKEIAYKTAVLEEENQVKALSDISLCVLHFFQEAHIKGEKFELISSPGELSFKEDSDADPLENVKFII